MKRGEGVGNAKFTWLATLSEESIIHCQKNVKEAVKGQISALKQSSHLPFALLPEISVPPSHNSSHRQLLRPRTVGLKLCACFAHT